MVDYSLHLISEATGVNVHMRQDEIQEALKTVMINKPLRTFGGPYEIGLKIVAHVCLFTGKEL